MSSLENVSSMTLLTRNGIVTLYTVECRLTSGVGAFLSEASFNISTMKGMNSSSAEPVIVKGLDESVKIVRDLAIKGEVACGGWEGRPFS
jgi:hypothetical protein